MDEKTAIEIPLMELSASEALYGFAGWLTGRDEPVTLGGRHDAGIAAELVNEFCKAHDLAEPRDGWNKSLWPKREEKETE